MVGLALAAVAVFPAFAGEVRNISIDLGATGTRAEIQLEGKGEYKTISLTGPDRLVVDLPASSAVRGLKLPAGGGIVKSVRTGQPAPDTFRIVFDLASPVVVLKPRMEPSATGSRLILEWPGDGPAKQKQAMQRPREIAQSAPDRRRATRGPAANPWPKAPCAASAPRPGKRGRTRCGTCRESAGRCART